jgi:hypothetical protein
MRCQAPKCSEKIVSKGLCDKHRIRMRTHGHLDSTRPSDWGKRTKHPLYGTWKWITARTITGACDEWKDFWTFVKDVGERPSTKHTIRRINESEVYSADNFFWKPRLNSCDDRNAYARKWRKHNPLATKSADLKKNYGIDINDYHDLLDKQGGVCGICGATENNDYKYFSVDHCHETGRVRGLLCDSCNRGLGFFRDSVKNLDAAKQYLSAL